MTNSARCVFYKQSPLHAVNTPGNGLYPVRQAGCSLGNNLLCVWIPWSYPWWSHSEPWVPYQPRNALLLCCIQNQRHTPDEFLSRPILVEVLQEAGRTDLQKETTPSHCTLHPRSFLVCPSPTLTTYLVTRGLRSTFCCPCVWRTGWLWGWWPNKFRPTQIWPWTSSKVSPMLSFILAATDNNQGIGGLARFLLFCISSHIRWANSSGVRYTSI